MLRFSASPTRRSPPNSRQWPGPGSGAEAAAEDAVEAVAAASDRMAAEEVGAAAIWAVEAAEAAEAVGGGEGMLTELD